MLATAALYGILPRALFITFDEVHRPYPAPFLSLASLCLGGGALAYMRSDTEAHLMLSLLGGLTASWLVSTVGLAAYWHGRQPQQMSAPFHWWGTASPMAMAWVVVAAILLMPVLLSLLRRAVRPRSTV